MRIIVKLIRYIKNTTSLTPHGTCFETNYFDFNECLNVTQLNRVIHTSFEVLICKLIQNSFVKCSIHAEVLYIYIFYIYIFHER